MCCHVCVFWILLVIMPEDKATASYSPLLFLFFCEKKSGCIRENKNEIYDDSQMSDLKEVDTARTTPWGLSNDFLWFCICIIFEMVEMRCYDAFFALSHTSHSTLQQNGNHDAERIKMLDSPSNLAYRWDRLTYFFRAFLALSVAQFNLNLDEYQAM